jgi:hypothetical protein
VIFQQLLWIGTESAGIRSPAVGWSAEDGSLAREIGDRHVGSVLSWNTRSRGHYTYPTVVHAMGAGWHVMAPPTQEEDGSWSRMMQRTVET